MHLPDPLSLALVLAAVSLVPTLLVCTTCFMKITVVMSLVRNALGVQQIPPNIALYGLSLILTAYIMAPIANRMYDAVVKQAEAKTEVEAIVNAARGAAEPLRGFLLKHSKAEQREFFMGHARQLWGPEMSADLAQSDFLIVMPAFLLTEITAAFQIGFLLFLPFIVIDLVISNILLAMGMMMVSPTTISLPLKLFLFVAVDGWSRLIHGVVMTYA